MAAMTYLECLMPGPVRDTYSHRVHYVKHYTSGAKQGTSEAAQLDYRSERDAQDTFRHWQGQHVSRAAGGSDYHLQMLTIVPL